MKKVLMFLCALAMFFVMVSNACATALLVQSGDVWSGNAYQPYDTMADLGIDYDQITHSDFNTTDLSGYDFVFLEGSDGETSNFDDYINMNNVYEYVFAGGLAIIHYADWSGDRTDVGPGGEDVFYTNIDSATIVNSYASDPLFQNVTNYSIDNWHYTAHGYLTNLPTGAEVLIEDDNNNPLYVRYGLGNGEVWITTMTLEWGLADHDLMVNELKLANQYQRGPTPVPEPATVLLMGVSLLGLTGMRKHMSRKN